MIKRKLTTRLTIVIISVCFTFLLVGCQSNDLGFVSLFNGKDLSGWKDNGETPNSFSVKDNCIHVTDGRSHLFYDGDVGAHNFKNFHMKVELKVIKGSNSGIHFHTKFQEKGWPAHGIECQINVSHKDLKHRSGSLYDLANVDTTEIKDGQWYTQEVIVEGQHVKSLINGKLIVAYTDPLADEGRHKKWMHRKISSGTFSIQGHDPTCDVYIKSFKVKQLPE